MTLASAVLLFALSAVDEDLTPPPLILPTEAHVADRAVRKQRMLSLLLEKDALERDSPSQVGPVMMIIGSVATGAGAALFTYYGVRANSSELYTAALLSTALHIAMGIFGPMLAVRQSYRAKEHDARVASLEGEVRGLLLPPPSLLPVEPLR